MTNIFSSMHFFTFVQAGSIPMIVAMNPINANIARCGADKAPTKKMSSYRINDPNRRSSSINAFHTASARKSSPSTRSADPLAWTMFRIVENMESFACWRAIAFIEPVEDRRFVEDGEDDKMPFGGPLSSLVKLDAVFDGCEGLDGLLSFGDDARLPYAMDMTAMDALKLLTGAV